jgi:hypothetical protein
MLRRIISDFRQLHWALYRFYRRRSRRRLSPEQEVERILDQLTRAEQARRWIVRR